MMISVATHEAQQPQVSAQVHAPAAAGAAKPEPAVFRSKLPDISIPNHLPLHTYCFEKASELPDNPCLISGATGRVYTYAETHLLCRRAAAGLARLGVRRKDVVFLLLPNSPEFVFSFFAASMLGAATTAANPYYTPAEIHKQLRSSGARLVVTYAANVDKFRDESLFPRVGEGLTVVTVDEPPEGCVAFSEVVGADEEGAPEVDVEPEDPVAIPFSSGTTGLPKGVVLTHKGLISSVAQQVDGENPNLHLTPEDVALCVLPLFHIFSLNSVLLCALRAGAAVLIMAKFEIGAMLGLIERHRVTMAAVVPPLVLALAKTPAVDGYDLSSIRIVLSGGAPVGKELLAALQQRVPQAIFGQVSPSFSSFFFLSFLFFFLFFSSSLVMDTLLTVCFCRSKAALEW